MFNKNATLIFLSNITKDPTDVSVSLDFFEKYSKSNNSKEIRFRYDDKIKCELYQYLCDTLTNNNKVVGEKMIKIFRILDNHIKTPTEYLLKSMRIGTYGFKEFNINTNDTLTRSKLNKVLSDIARITSETNIDYIKMECDDVKWSRDQYNNMLK